MNPLSCPIFLPEGKNKKVSRWNSDKPAVHKMLWAFLGLCGARNVRKTPYRGGDFMTDEQKQQVIWLRREGLGYTAIAKRTGISRDTVRSFCRRNGMSGERVKGQPGYCRECQKVLLQTKGMKTRSFCSKECREKWWKEHPEQVNRRAVYSFTCAGCQKIFTAYGNSKRKYCSHACYIRKRFGGGMDG